MNTVKLTMGEKIADLLNSKNLDEKDLAKETGISAATISDLINDVEKDYGYKKLLKIANYFNVSYDYLVGISETPSIDEDIKRVCNYTGLTTLNVKTLNYLNNNDIIGSGFMDFLNMMIDKISANDRLVIDIEQVRENKTTYTMIAEKIIEKGIETETEEDILRLEDLKYITNGLSYEITTAINRIYENYTLSNCGYNIEQFEELQQELK